MTGKIIAYDLGTGGAKASLYDVESVCLASVFVAYETLYSDTGWQPTPPTCSRGTACIRWVSSLSRTSRNPRKRQPSPAPAQRLQKVGGLQLFIQFGHPSTYFPRRA